MNGQEAPHPMRRKTDVLAPESHLERAWRAVRSPGRRARLNRWRKTPAVVTRGYLAFRDFVVLGLCVAIVLAGISAIRDLRREDCASANVRRAELEDVALKLLDNDRNLIALADAQSEHGLPDEFKTPLLERYDSQEAAIRAAYAPAACPERGRVIP